MSIKSKEDLLNKQAEVNEQIKSYTCRVLVCSGTGCIASGAQKIYEEMSVLCERIDGVTVEMQKDVPHVGVIKTGCQGLCELGPLMRIEPYDYQYVHVQPEELKRIMEWTKTNVVSTLHLCWGAQAGIYYHYGIDKVQLPEKRSGLFWHHVRNRKIPIVRGFDDKFLAPHSRHTEVPQDLLEKDDRITILADSEEAGVYLCMAQDGRQIFVMGHPEYDRMTLDSEYKRDLGKGLNPQIPENYYPNDDPEKKPMLTWRAHCNNLYTNWLNYYVYQVTPYDLYGTPF